MQKDELHDAIVRAVREMITPQDRKDGIAVTKQAAARRLIEAGIRCQFAREDPFVPILVAFAAEGMLRDLLKKRAPDSVRRIWQECYEIGLKLALKAADIDAEVRVELPIHLQSIGFDNSVSNFLKHADRDSIATIETSTGHAIQKLMYAVVYYDELALPTTETMDIFRLWCSVYWPKNINSRLKLNDGRYFNELELEEQLRAGEYLLRESLDKKQEKDVQKLLGQL